MKFLASILLLLPLAAAASDADYTLVIKDHRFQPGEITIPSNKKVKLLIQNQDASVEEFDSYALNREKVISGGSSATIFIGPLAPGRYPFMGEFHADSAQGAVVAQ